MAQGPVLPISGELETLGWGHGPGMRGETAGGRLLALNSKAVTLDSDLFQSQPPYIKNKTSGWAASQVLREGSCSPPGTLLPLPAGGSMSLIIRGKSRRSQRKTWVALNIFQATSKNICWKKVPWTPFEESLSGQPTPPVRTGGKLGRCQTRHFLPVRDSWVLQPVLASTPGVLREPSRCCPRCPAIKSHVGVSTSFKVGAILDSSQPLPLPLPGFGLTFLE